MNMLNMMNIKMVSSKELEDSFFQYVETGEEEIVKQILQEVKEKGDTAVRFYTNKFDELNLTCFEINKKQILEAYKQVDKETIEAIEQAAERIRNFAQAQRNQLNNFEIKNKGLVLGQKVVPLQSVGCYVPGGRYPLPSSALMTIIPAKVAGVKEIIVCSPKIQPVTIVAAYIAGATRIFNVGGVQAIGAMTYGTKTIPKVDKIVGPGNRFVTAAKKQVYGQVGIDFLAGPSEVMIIADETGNPAYIAADLLAQAEHDPNARADLITTSKKLAEQVQVEVARQLETLKTKDTAVLALQNSFIVFVEDLNEAVDIANKKAPEHLELQVKDPRLLSEKLVNYGSLFIGKYAAEVFGDYTSGTNHTLPTNGASKYTGGLSVRDFVKLLTYQEMDKESAQMLLPVAIQLATVEGLDAHRRAAEIRKE